MAISREQIFEFGRALPGTGIDTPFDEDFETTVMRHSLTGKWYALVFKAPCRKLGMDRDGVTDIINLKCDPFMSYGLMESYDAIVPAYHMNKYHWISVILERDIPQDVLEMLIRQSYDLTKAKPRRKKT